MLSLDTDAERIAAVLHDVVEDTDWTLDRLRAEGFAEEVLRAIDHVTRQPGETYEAFVRRAAADPVASRVKAADIRDNLDLSRIPKPTDHDRARLAKYERALAVLHPDRVAG
jgi:(p)ppGpp synthase/HD superfamily hydrolase